MTAARATGDAPIHGVRWARRYRNRLRITDTTIVVAVVLSAAAARMGFGVDAVPEPAPVRVGVPLLIAGSWLTMLAAFRTRDPHIAGVGATEYRRVLNATATAFGLVAIIFLLAESVTARWYFVVAFPAGATGLLLGRWLWRKWLITERRYGHFLARTLVVGEQSDVEYIAAKISRDRCSEFYIVGVALEEDGVDEIVVQGRHIPVLAGVSSAASAAARQHADSVIVTGNYGSGGESIRRLSWELEGTATELVLSSRLTDVAGPRIHYRPVDGLPLLRVEIPTFDGWRHILKRSFDVTFASLALLVVAPFFPFIALAIRLDSSGPAMFRQQRCGRDARTFTILKFRTMVETAEADRAALLERNEGSGMLFKIRDDPRITRVGHVLRKFSVDELPQFWNVLVGDMSVVGPRPPLTEEAARYEDAARRRLLIKPGLTGMWQISGRSDLSWEESVRLDLYYVENWSLTGDLMIVWRTVKTVAHPKGAY